MSFRPPLPISVNENPVCLKMSSYGQEGACQSSPDGERLYGDIAEAFVMGHRVQISFSGIHVITATFLNQGIGQLYAQFSAEDVRRLLSVVDATQEHLTLVKQVVDNAKSYFALKKQAP